MQIAKAHERVRSMGRNGQLFRYIVALVPCRGFYFKRFFRNESLKEKVLLYFIDFIRVTVHF